MSHVSPEPRRKRIPVVLSATALLSFVPVWRATALAFAELGAGMFFLAGVANSVLGSWTPWCLLVACLSSGLARAIDVECWTLFLPGGLIGRAAHALGARAARPAAAMVLAERFLFAALASVVLGQYVSRVAVIAVAGSHLSRFITFQDVAGPVAVALLGALWLRARRGLDLAPVRVAQGILIGLGIVAVVITWDLLTPDQPAALATPLSQAPAVDLEWTTLLGGLALVLPALGGGDAVSRVARDLPPPRVAALRRTALFVTVLAVAFISVPSFLFERLGPTDRASWHDAPLAGIAHALGGPHWLRDFYAIAVCAAAFLVLVPTVSAAVRDGTQALRWLATRHAISERMATLHPRLGTTARAIDAGTVASVLIVLSSGARVTWLAHAYAVVFAASLVVGVAVLARTRRSRPQPQPYLAPFNATFAGQRIPLGPMCLAGGAAVTVAALLGEEYPGMDQPWSSRGSHARRETPEAGGRRGGGRSRRRHVRAAARARRVARRRRCAARERAHLRSESAQPRPSRRCAGERRRPRSCRPHRAPAWR